MSYSQQYKCEECHQWYNGRNHYIDGKKVCDKCKQELIDRAEAGIERRLMGE